jgi:hypothetical protein
MNMQVTRVVAVCMMLLSPQAFALTFNESSDAGVTMGTATSVPAGTTLITGSIVNTTENDVDLYLIHVPASGSFTIEAKANVVDVPDMNLLVFDSTGHFIAGDDDNNSSCTNMTPLNGYDSCLTLTLTAGDYYIAVGNNNIGAFQTPGDVPGGYFADNDSGILASPSPEVIGLVASENSLGNDEGGYTINLNAAPVSSATSIPTLSEWGMIILSSLLALGAVLTLRRQRQ